MNRLAVLNVVGLSSSLLGEHTPRISAWAKQKESSSFRPAFPAVTCTAQSDFLTGKNAGEHGIVGNGWYDRTLSEIHFWKQSNAVVEGEKLWHRLKKVHPKATVAQLFWWYNMYADVDYSITPRPMYPADGSKIFDIYTHPAPIRFDIQKQEALGKFPFPSFWGPNAGIESSKWIAESAKWIEQKHQPTLSLVYLPHLDYPLQKLGPNHPDISTHLKAIDEVVGDLLDFYQQQQVEPVLLSEYGITPVEQVCHPNRILREAGLLAVKPELGLEQLDAGASKAFAVADHQIAHIYLQDAKLLDSVRKLFQAEEAVESVVTPTELGWMPTSTGAQRSGDLILIAKPNAWFTWYHWLEDDKAPDFARTIDIHRKSGYDPCELFIDPAIKNPKWKIGLYLLKKKLGFRGLLDIIPLRPELVKGSHGHPNPPKEFYPLAIGRNAETVTQSRSVYQWLASLLHC